MAEGALVTGAFFEIPLNFPDDTFVAIYARVTDSAGNSHCHSNKTITFTEDSTAPTGTTVSSISPLSNSGESVLVLDGTAEPHADVLIFTDGSCAGKPAGQAKSTMAGEFRAHVPVPKGVSIEFFTMTIDYARNASPCVPSGLIHDPVSK